MRCLSSICQRWASFRCLKSQRESFVFHCWYSIAELFLSASDTFSYSRERSLSLLRSLRCDMRGRRSDADLHSPHPPEISPAKTPISDWPIQNEDPDRSGRASDRSDRYGTVF